MDFFKNLNQGLSNDSSGLHFKILNQKKPS